MQLPQQTELELIVENVDCGQSLQTAANCVETIMITERLEATDATVVVATLVTDTISAIAVALVSHSKGSWSRDRLQKVVEFRLGGAEPNSAVFVKEVQSISRRFPL